LADQCRDKGHYDGKALKDETFKYPIKDLIMQQYQPLTFISYDEYLENWGQLADEYLWMWFTTFNYGLYNLTEDQMYSRFLRWTKYLTVKEELQVGFNFTCHNQPYCHGHAMMLGTNETRTKSLLDINYDKWERVWMLDQEGYYQNYLESNPLPTLLPYQELNQTPDKQLSTLRKSISPYKKSQLSNIRNDIMLLNNTTDTLNLHTIYDTPDQYYSILYNFLRPFFPFRDDTTKSNVSYIIKKRSGKVIPHTQKPLQHTDKLKKDSYGNVIGNADLYKDESRNTNNSRYWIRKKDGKRFPINPSVSFPAPYDLMIETVDSVQKAGSYLGKNIVQSGFYHQRSRKGYLKQFCWADSLRYE